MKLKRCKLCGCIIYDEFRESNICDVCEDDIAQGEEDEDGE